MRRAIPAALAAALVVAGGCGGDGDGGGAHPRSAHGVAYRNARYGYRVTIPDGWQRAPRPLATITDPREILAAATFRPVVRDEGCAQFPTAAVHHMPVAGVLVEVQERAGSPSSEFVPRPRHFGHGSGTDQIELVDCVPKPAPFRPFLVTFRDGRRLFYALVAIGTSASASARREAFALLDSLRFDPRRKARWRAAG